MGEGWALCVYVKERDGGGGLSVRVALAGGVYKGGYEKEKSRRGRTAQCFGGMCFEGSQCEIFGGLNRPPPPCLKPPCCDQ